VFRRDRNELLHSELSTVCDETASRVALAVEGRRHNAFGGGPTDLSEESLELKRLEANQGPGCIGRRPDERVGHPLGTERKRTG
jgi:hypothetical protein